MFGTFCCQPSSPIGTIDQVDFSTDNLKELSGLNRKHVLLEGGGGGEPHLTRCKLKGWTIRRNPKYANEITEKMLPMDEVSLAQELQ